MKTNTRQRCAFAGHSYVAIIPFIKLTLLRLYRDRGLVHDPG